MSRSPRWIALSIVAAMTLAKAGAQDAAPSPAAPAPPPAASSAQYHLREGDQIAISTFGFTEFTQTATVRPDGKISFPTIGDIYVVGLTPTALAHDISIGVARFVKNPRVTVTLVSSITERYFVSGEVTKPGAFPLTAGTGVREAIVAASDITLLANDQTASILRNGERIPVDLNGALHGDASKNTPLQPGDTLVIDRALITFEGVVNGTGQQPFRRGTTLRQALAAVGDPKPGADIERIQILRGSQTIVANLRDITADPTKDVPLQAGDIIKVDEADERSVPVFITGAVGHQGSYRYLPGRRDTIQDALNFAGGAGSDADLSRVKVRRTEEGGKTQELTFDLRTLEGRNARIQENDYIDVAHKRNKSGIAGSLTTALSAIVSVVGIVIATKR